jgi:HK97 family phage prohead protease
MQFKGTGNLLVKDLDTKRGIVQAYWSAYGVKDDQGDIVDSSCWLKSIRERGPQSVQPRIKFLYQHEEKMLLGKPSELISDSFGLLATTQIVPTTLGLDTLLLYEFGVLAEHSVGYEVVQAQWDSKASARHLVEGVLWEGSAVTWGACSQTPVVALKSLTHPQNLTAMAERAAKIDKLLHDGSLRTDALCESLDRELKSLHAALAPASAPERPYTIQGVLDSMNDLARRLEAKGASGKTTWPLGERDAAWDNGAAHKRIEAWATKDNGDVDVAKLKSVHFYSPDGDDAEDISKYKLLFCDIESGDVKAMPRAIFACAGAHGVEGTTGISDSDKDAIKGKIEAYYRKMAKQFDDDTITVPWADDGAKGADMGKRLIKGTGGDVEVSEDGTHAAYTGTHEHSHKAMGSQGDDEMHDHLHEHKGDAKHSHEHEKASARPHAHKQQPHHQMQKAPNGRPIRKARDFGTLFAALNESDQLQDDWGDTFIALVQAMEELMWQSCMQNGGYVPEGAETVDITAAAQANLDAFSKAAMSLVQRSVAADFVPEMTDDRDQFIDPDGPNAASAPDSDYDDADDWKSRRTSATMPDAPARLGKAGRAIGSANRQIITDALDGQAKAMADMKMHHKAIADLMTKTDPDAVRQDEDDTQGDDDSENGGTNINKSRFALRTTTHAPERHKSAATTHQGSDHTALFADFDALASRFAGRKAK